MSNYDINVSKYYTSDFYLSGTLPKTRLARFVGVKQITSLPQLVGSTWNAAYLLRDIASYRDIWEIAVERWGKRTSLEQPRSMDEIIEYILSFVPERAGLRIVDAQTGEKASSKTHTFKLTRNFGALFPHIVAERIENVDQLCGSACSGPKE